MSYPVYVRFAALTLLILSGATRQTAHAQNSPTSPSEDRTEYQTRVMIASADGSNVGTVMHTPGFTTHGSPRWSRDGKMVAIDAWKKGETHVNAKIIIAHLDGSKVLTLGDGAMPTFSPDGTQIVFSRYSPNHGIWIQRIDESGHEPQQIVRDGWSGAWLPDGDAISFTTYRSGRPNICIHSIEDAEQRFLFERTTENPFRQLYWNYAWSNDGKYVAVPAVTGDGQSELITIDARGASYGLTRHPIKSLAQFISWTPDNRLMLGQTVGGKQQLYTIDPQQPDSEPTLFHIDTDRKINSGSVSPDGKLVLFIMYSPLPDFAKF